MSSISFISWRILGTVSLFKFICSSGWVVVSVLVLFCISLMTNDVKRLLLYLLLLVIHMSSLWDICSNHLIYFFLFFFFKHLYWSIIASQWCVSFCFITKWISYTYTHVPISPPSCISLHPPYPTPLHGHRAPSWSPCAMWLLSTSYLFYIW